MRVLVIIAIAGCGGSHASPDARGDAPDPACAGVVCDDPPAATCMGNVLATFELPGTCTDGTCSYARDARTCVGACSNARCAGGWGAMSEHGTPNARYDHATVWTGHEMIVWGGAIASTESYGDGARYDPATAAWHAIATTNAPSPRRDHTAIWTGHEMIVWGGTSITQGTGLADGGRYDPVTDRWTPLPATGAPQGRFAHTAVWTGTEMIVWGGGILSTESLDDGAAFDPAANTWRPIASSGAPAPRRDHTAVWTGTEMIVWGGSSITAGGTVYDDLFAYDPVADTWTPMASLHVPPARFSHAAAWTGDEMIVFGGATSSTATLGDGWRFDRAAGEWTALPATGQPSPRRDHSAVWTGSAVLVWGGSTIVDGGTVLDDGGAFRVYQ